MSAGNEKKKVDAGGDADTTASRVMETKVFKSGNSYAVRLPKLVYSGGEAPVYVKKLEGGKLLIVPKVKERWPTGFLESFGNVPGDFEAPVRPAANPADDERAAALFGTEPDAK
jgi:virulence-associated protein VagC